MRLFDGNRQMISCDSMRSVDPWVHRHSRNRPPCWFRIQEEMIISARPFPASFTCTAEVALRRHSAECSSFHPWIIWPSPPRRFPEQQTRWKHGDLQVVWQAAFLFAPSLVAKIWRESGVLTSLGWSATRACTGGTGDGDCLNSISLSVSALCVHILDSVLF